MYITRQIIEAYAMYQPISCEAFVTALDSIDFKAFNDVESFGEAGYYVEDSVAVIKIRGILVPDLGIDLSAFGLTGYDIIQYYVENANEDTKVDRIVLDIDSGGGIVKGMVKATKAITNSEKPVTTYVSGNMYSAAYHLGVATDRIVASEEAGIGSIGVIVEFLDRSGQDEMNGINRKRFRSGDWKGAFDPNFTLTKQEETKLQGIVMKEAGLFFAHVSDNRNIPVSEIAALEGDTFGAEDALKLNLIDEIEDTNTMSNTAPVVATAAQTPAPAVAPVAAQPAPAVAPVAAMPSVDPVAAQEALIAQAVERGRNEANAEHAARDARHAEIDALPDGTAKMKEQFKTEAFESVAVAEIGKMLASAPKTFTQASDAEGGAGVGDSPTEFAEQTPAQLKAKQAEDAAAVLAANNTSVL